MNKQRLSFDRDSITKKKEDSQEKSAYQELLHKIASS